MATVLNTVEYAFDTRTTSLATATRHDFSSITLTIEENSSRVFRSVYVKVFFRDDSTTAPTVTDWLIGIKLGATAFSDVTTTETISSNEHLSQHLTRDVTSYFTSNFGSGTTQTCQVGVSVTGVATINLAAKLVITYEYDDTSQTTRTKTCRIPFDGNTSSLATTLTEMGTNQIPNLSTFLPEDTKSFKDIFFEVIGGEGNTTTTDFQIGLALDSESEVLDGAHQCDLASAPWVYYIWKRTDMTTNATHAFKIRATQTNRMNMSTIILVVTYTYNHSNSTSIMNSVLLPFSMPGMMGATTSSDNARKQIKFFANEPATIALVQSGCYVYFTDSSNVGGINLRVGGQSYRTYTHAAGTATTGGSVFSQRIDSGGVQGSGITFARGLNTFVVDLYSTDTADWGTVVCGYIILNYTSGKATNGADTHNRTVFFCIADTETVSNDLQKKVIASFAPTIPESNYYINASAVIVETITLGAQSGFAFRYRKGSSNEGWVTYWADMYFNDNFYSPQTLIAETSSYFKRYPTDPAAERDDIETARPYHFLSSYNSQMGILMAVTYHTITYTFSGQLSGYSGDGSGVTVDIHRSDNDELVGSVTTGVNGTYTFTWYDNTITLYAHARQSSTLVGRSDNLTPA